jgi:hypothetical protein
MIKWRLLHCCVCSLHFILLCRLPLKNYHEHVTSLNDLFFKFSFSLLPLFSLISTCEINTMKMHKVHAIAGLLTDFSHETIVKYLMDNVKTFYDCLMSAISIMQKRNFIGHFNFCFKLRFVSQFHCTIICQMKGSLSFSANCHSFYSAVIIVKWTRVEAYVLMPWRTAF